MDNNTPENICENIFNTYSHPYVSEAFKLLNTLFNNIICNPLQDKFRNFKITNVTLKTKVLVIKETLQLIQSIGYIKQNDEIYKYEGEPQKLNEITYILNKYISKVQQEINEEQEKEKQKEVEKKLAEIQRQNELRRLEKEKIRQQLENDKKERLVKEKPTDSIGKNLQFGATEIKVECKRTG